MILLISCSPNQKFLSHPSIKEVHFMDFRPYLLKGFYFSPNDLKGEYEVMGDVLLEYFPPYKEKLEYTGNVKSEFNKYEDPIYDKPDDFNSYEILKSFKIYDNIDMSLVLDMAYQEAIKVGGNGIIYFKVITKDIIPLSPKEIIIAQEGKRAIQVIISGTVIIKKMYKSVVR
jgi:hypothetical protein